MYWSGVTARFATVAVVAGRFPVTRELAAELGALMAQLDMGDFAPANSQHNQPLAHRFYPYRYRAGLSNDELRSVVSSFVVSRTVVKLDLVASFECAMSTQQRRGREAPLEVDRVEGPQHSGLRANLPQLYQKVAFLWCYSVPS